MLIYLFIYIAILKLKQDELLERDLEGILKIIGNLHEVR